MSRLIDADPLLLALDKRKSYELANGRNRAYGKGVRDAMKDVDDQPTVDAVPLVHGHWIKADLDHNYVTCSNCKELNRDDRLAFIPDYAKGMHYCMICGAKMDAFAKDINVSCKSDEVTE